MNKLKALKMVSNIRIQIIGSGVVGFNTGQGFKHMGYDVTFYDIDTTQLMKISQQGYKVTNEMQDADLHFFCVPEKQLDKAFEIFVIKRIKGLPIIRSTAPPGTTKRLSKEFDIHICHNPEFLREKFALWDFLVPSRILIGQCCDEHGKILEDLFKPLNTSMFRSDSTTTEITKIVNNAYLATLISFWNEIYSLCDKLNVNINQVAKFCILDRRVSHYGTEVFSHPYGGTCIPKDTEQLLQVAKDVDIDTILLKSVKEVNERLKKNG